MQRQQLRKTNKLPSRPSLRLFLECLEDRNLLDNGMWTAWFQGLSSSTQFMTQAESGRRLLQFAGVPTSSINIVRASDLSGAFQIQAPLSFTKQDVVNTLQGVPGFVQVEDYTELDPLQQRKFAPAKGRSEALYGPFDYDTYLTRYKNGEFPDQSGPVLNPPERTDVLVNNNGGASTSSFTQSETSLVAFGSTVIIGFNDSGSNAGGTNKFTGFSRSTDGGTSFVDGGTLPNNAGGDAGDPVLARNETSGRIYFSTLGFNVGTIQVFHSDDNGLTWSAPVVGTPGGASEDKQWLAVDNFAGPGNGNVYLISRNFGAGNGIFVYRSTDNGATFGPNGGTLITSGNQGAYVTVGPDHSVYAFWFAGTTIQMRKSTDFGATFGPSVTVASGIVGGTNGDHSLTGIRQGVATASGFRSNAFPHVTINPVSGNLYVVYGNDGPGADKADIQFVQSTNGGTTWSSPVTVNDDGTTTDQWQPTLTVSTDGSRLGFFYYSRQEDTVGNNLFKYYGRLATISGPTVNFLPSFAVSDVASLPEFGRDSVVNSVYMGDYDQAVATPGYFHTIWSDNRDDLAGGAPRKDPNIYYRKIPLGLAVSSTVPASGSTINSQPTVFTVNVTDPMQSSSVQATDLTVNGIPADSVSYLTGSTQAIFTFNTSPVTTEGLQAMHIDAGAFLRSPDNDPSIAFDGSFRYDITTLQVTSTSPGFPNGLFTLPGPLTYDVTFNEALDPASIQATDLVLSGIPGAFVSGFTLLPGDTTIRFTINGAVTEGILTATINAGSVTDVFSNPGLSFTANYEVDFGVVALPTPLNAINPLGSLVYDPVVSGRVNFAGDIDTFTFNVDPGQTITILMTPTQATLQPTIELRDPANTVIGTTNAGAVNQNALLQTVAATTGGVYTIRLSGVGGSIGNYTFEVTLNAAIENETTLPGSGNDTLANAQSVNSSFITLQTALATAQRGAVRGTTDVLAYSVSAVPFAFEDISSTGTIVAGLTNQDDASVTTNIGFSFPFYGTNYTTVFVGANGLLSFVSTNTAFTNTDLTTAPAQASIAVFWDDLHTAGGQLGSNVFTQVLGAGPNQRYVIQWNQIRFFSGGTANDTITFQAQLYADGRIQMNYLDLTSGTAAGNNGASATSGTKNLGNQGPDRILLAFNNGPNAFLGTGLSTLISPPSPIADYYSFNMQAGQTITAALTSMNSLPINFELRDNANVVVATGSSGPVNVSRVLNNFVIPTTGTYYLSVSAPTSSVPYTLVTNRNADFDTESNNSFATAQNLGNSQGVLGAITADSVYAGTAVPFAFEDISSTGTIVAGLTNQDDASVSIPIGFNFKMYSTTYTSLFASANGLITFGAANGGFTNADLTLTPAEAAIAVFWDDLHTAGGLAGSNVFTQVTGTGNNQHLTIQWNQIRFFSGGTAGDTITFQVQLYADGRIQMNYQDLVSGAAAGNNGASATVGIKDAGTQGLNRLLLAFNNGPNAFVNTGLSTLIQAPPPGDWYKVTVSSLAQQLIIDTLTPSDGVGEPGNTLDPQIELYDPNGVLVRTGVTRPDGRNETIKLRKQTLIGDYRIRVVGQNGTFGEYFLGVTLVNPPSLSGPMITSRLEGAALAPLLLPTVRELAPSLNTTSVISPASSMISATPSRAAVSNETYGVLMEKSSSLTAAKDQVATDDLFSVSFGLIKPLLA